MRLRIVIVHSKLKPRFGDKPTCPSAVVVFFKQTCPEKWIPYFLPSKEWCAQPKKIFLTALQTLCLSQPQDLEEHVHIFIYRISSVFSSKSQKLELCTCSMILSQYAEASNLGSSITISEMPQLREPWPPPVPPTRQRTNIRHQRNVRLCLRVCVCPCPCPCVCPCVFVFVFVFVFDFVMVFPCKKRPKGFDAWENLH